MAGKGKRLQSNRGAVRASDVARLANCSTATVSRVQNNPDQVSAETRNRVQAAIRELMYMPNGAARTLRSQRSRLVGIIIPTLNHAIYASLVEAAQRRLTAGGYSLLVATFDYDLDLEMKQAALLVERGSEALILIGAQHRPELYRLMLTASIPYINTYVYSPDSPHPCIGIDNAAASMDIADFLCSLGHRRFGVISASLAQNDRASARVSGVREGLRRRGIDLPADAVVERSYGIANGRDGLRVLSALTPPPTAIVCGNDILALGALIEAREMGLGVPEDVSIVGFDDLDFSSQLTPPLTTMEVPAREMGEGAAAFVLDTLGGRPTSSRVRLEPKLVARRSTALAPAPG